MPTVSVVIPMKNRQHTIQRCLDSILNQSRKPDEVIVVDDGSTDDSVSITSAYGEQIRCIKHETSLGAQAARNTGIKAAFGDIIAFQDSDDIWLQDKLDLQIPFMESNNADLVHSYCLSRDAKTGAYNLFGLDLYQFQGDNARSMLLSRPGPMFQGMLVARQRLLDINLLDESIPAYQEWDTYIRLSKTCRIGYLNVPLFIYAVGANDAISHSKERELKGYQAIVEKHKIDILKICGKATLANHYKHLMHLAHEINDPEKLRGFRMLYSGLA